MIKYNYKHVKIQLIVCWMSSRDLNQVESLVHMLYIILIIKKEGSCMQLRRYLTRYAAICWPSAEQLISYRRGWDLLSFFLFGYLLPAGSIRQPGQLLTGA